MTVPIRCPNPDCGAAGSIDEASLGRRGRCRKCGHAFEFARAGGGDAASGDWGDTSAWKGSPPSPAEPGRPAGPGDLPERFGRYLIRGRLGQGGMGTVYRAHDTKLGREVALKVPSFAPADGIQAIQRFEREARAAATLDHPNLCPVFDVGEVDGVHYLTMPYFEGKPLAEALGHGRQLPEAEAVALTRTLALALQEAHDRGVVHRDLKPGNILVDGRGRLVVVDFGLARLAEADEAPITRVGHTLGTAIYMAPEQAAGGSEAGLPAVDIYALGVILYELLAGVRPFEGPWSLVIGLKSVQDPEPPSAHRPGLNPALDALCLRALARRPSDRFASMAAFAAILEDFLPSADDPGSRPIREPEDPAVRILAGIRTEGADDRLAAQGAEARGPTAAPAGLWPRRPNRSAMIGGAALLLVPLGVILFSAGSNRGGKHSIPPVLGAPGPGPTAPAAERPVDPPPIREPLDRVNPPGRVVACRGDWKIVGDSLRQSSLARGYGLHPLLIFGDPDWSEYDLTLEAKKEGGAEGFRIQFHWQDQVTFDSFGLGIYGNRMHMFRDMHDGTFIRVNEKRIEDNPIQADRWYSLKIQVRGKSCRCYLDDELLFEGANFRFDHGRIGLATWETSAQFRNIRVATPTGRTLFEGFPSVSDLSGDPRVGAGSPQDQLRRGNTDGQLKILSNVAGARVGAKRLAELFHGTLRDDEVLSLDLFYSRNDVLFTHPLAQDEPAIIDFSKLTEAAEGRLFLFCKSFPAIGYNAKVVIRKAGKFCMDRTIIGDKDREWDVIIVPFSHESLLLEHHAANRDHELLITDYLILDK